MNNIQQGIILIVYDDKIYFEQLMFCLSFQQRRWIFWLTFFDSSEHFDLSYWFLSKTYD